MLKFNSNHKNINGSLKNNFNKVWLRSAFLGGALVSSVMLFSGCAKDVECSVSEPHAHYYVSEKKFDKLMISEKERKGSWYREDDYVLVDEELAELIDFENKKKLYSISENRDEIDVIVSTHGSWIEYEYRYTYYDSVLEMFGTRYRWTTDPDRSRLTGRQRVVRNIYYGYKIVRNDKGELEAVRSEMVENLNDLPEDYTYIKGDFYDRVYWYVNEPMMNQSQEAAPDESESQLKLVP